MCNVGSCEAAGTIYLSATSQTLKHVCVVLRANQDLNQDELVLYSSQQPTKSCIKEPNTRHACLVLKSSVALQVLTALFPVPATVQGGMTRSVSLWCLIQWCCDLKVILP